MWVTPEWNGIDNQADLIFFILKDQGPIPVEEVFLGPSEEHPEIIDGRFVIPNPTDYYLGKPQKNKPGIFIYLAPDTSKIFNRWNLDIVYDGYDGYHDGYAPNLTINVQTHGSFYDVKNTPGSMTTGGTIRSGENQINFELNSSGSIDQGITFTADYEHYFFDFGTDFETKYKEKKPFFIRQLQDYLLTEEGDYFITEDGDGILVENGTGTGSPVTVDTTGFIGTEDGDPITTESGEQLII